MTTQAPVPGLRAQAKAEVFRRIRGAAEELLAHRDFDHITTREVAQRAGIGEATLFRHVASKDDLLTMVYADQMDALVERLLQQDDEQASHAIRDGFQICDRVKAIYRGRADFFRENPVNASRYLYQAFDPESRNHERAIAQGDTLIQRTTEILEQGQQARVIDSRANAFLVAQNCHGILMHEIQRTPVRGFDPQTIWKRVVERLDVQLMVLVRPIQDDSN